MPRNHYGVLRPSPIYFLVFPKVSHLCLATDAQVRPANIHLCRLRRAVEEGHRLSPTRKRSRPDFLVTGLPDPRALFSVPLATQPAVQLGKPQRLFSLREKGLQEFDFAVAPDGQRFVMVQGIGDEAGSRAMYLLQGWPTLLKQAHTK